MRKYGLLILITFGAIVGIFFMNERNNVELDENDVTNLFVLDEFQENEQLILENKSVQGEKWFVDVKGEVMRPGLYEVDVDTRVKNVIDLAGGFTELAAEEQINLAQKVMDEMVIYVPKIGEEDQPVITQNANMSGNNSDKVNVNNATAEELTKLNGIGPSKAEAIITYREENGPFTEIDDLLQVSGIGEKTLDNIRDNLIIP